MTLSQLIKENKDSVAGKWYEKLLSSYPKQTLAIWKRNKDKFTNPVGSTFSDALGDLVVSIADWNDAAAMCASLERIVKIRAVQDFDPGKSLAFIFTFKKVVREVLEEEIREQKLAGELQEFDSRVDNLALMGFDIYSKCREQIYDMRLTEFKNKHHMLFRKAGITCADPGDAQGTEESSEAAPKTKRGEGR